MKTAAIVIDAWKLPIFKKTLDIEGYKYSEHIGPGKYCITLKVKTDSIANLYLIVERMNKEAKISRMH